MLSFIWNIILAKQGVPFTSQFFFIFIAQTTQFSCCLLYSMKDLSTSRVSLDKIVPPAAFAVLGFLPFVLLWSLDLPYQEITLPLEAPSLLSFVVQFIGLGMIGDFFHYWTHRFLHSNKFLRHYVHNVHHNYEGALYSWIGMQVHPLEVFMITLAIYTPLVLFSHPLVLWTFAFSATMNAAIAHSGYTNGGFAAFLPPGWALSPNDHQMHHEKDSTKNYGNILRVWDRWFLTYGK
jgi:sterol desaturase/sphingolipid hydroxylase (fatty acid hydroxylase superfamily)